MKTERLRIVGLVLGLSVWMVSLTSALTSDLFLSTAETSMLLESEKELLGFLHQCLSRAASATGNAQYERLAWELQNEQNNLPKVQNAKHPLDAYVGLRRFTQYWNKYITRLDPVIAGSVEKSLAKSHLTYPDEEVLQQARLAIVRLQAAYNLSAFQLITSASANLTAQDRGQMAVEAQSIGFPLLAEEWRHSGESFVAQVPQRPDGPTLQSQKPEAVQTEETQSIHRKHTKFFSLCQHFQHSDDVMVLRSEGCVYTAGLVPIHRWKTEVLSSDPFVVLFYDFVNDREADFIVDKAMVRLTRALTGATPDDFTLKVQHRLGKIAWLREGSGKMLRKLTLRIEDVTKLNSAYRESASFGEDFQVVNYGIGGQYIPHHDYFQTKSVYREAEKYLQDSGDRAATFMIYLGDVSQGGATVFPYLGIGVPPVKNAALFWYNFTPDGLPDSRTLHGGCPVIIGHKWVVNKWIHEISTAMTRSCQLSPWKPQNN